MHPWTVVWTRAKLIENVVRCHGSRVVDAVKKRSLHVYTHTFGHACMHVHAQEKISGHEWKECNKPITRQKWALRPPLHVLVEVLVERHSQLRITASCSSGLPSFVTSFCVVCVGMIKFSDVQSFYVGARRQICSPPLDSSLSFAYLHLGFVVCKDQGGFHGRWREPHRGFGSSLGGGHRNTIDAHLESRSNLLESLQELGGNWKHLYNQYEVSWIKANACISCFSGPMMMHNIVGHAAPQNFFSHQNNSSKAYLVGCWDSASTFGRNRKWKHAVCADSVKTPSTGIPSNRSKKSASEVLWNKKVGSLRRTSASLANSTEAVMVTLPIF